MAPNLEILELRLVPSTVDVAAFQQQVPALHAKLVSSEPGIQAGLQNFVDSVKSQVNPQQLAFAQYVVDNFAAFADAWFYQVVAQQEAALLQIGQPAPASRQTAVVHQYGTSLPSPPIYHPVYYPSPTPVDPTPVDSSYSGEGGDF